jgi:hypothetical protein
MEAGQRGMGMGSGRTYLELPWRTSGREADGPWRRGLTRRGEGKDAGDARSARRARAAAVAGDQGRRRLYCCCPLFHMGLNIVFMSSLEHLRKTDKIIYLITAVL